MIFIPIVAGWALGVTSAHLADNGRQRYLDAPSMKEAVKASRVGAGIEAVQTFKKDKIDGYIEDSHAQSQKELSLAEEELSIEEQIANQILKNSTILLASTSLSALLYPPLLYLHIPPMLYMSIPFYKQGLKELFEKRQVTFTGVDTVWGIISISSSLFKPHFLVYGAVAGWLFGAINKIVVKTKENTRKQLTNLFGQQPQYVWLLRDDPASGSKGTSERGIEVEVPFESVQVGDIVIINAGQMIPVDGTIHGGEASIDQQMLTGESQPAKRGKGDVVFAATVVLSGKIYIQVEKTGAETAAAQIGQVLIQTSDYTSTMQLRGREIADQAGLPTLTLGILALLFFGADKALAVLYAGIGRNMQIFGSLSLLNYLQLTARQGILIKDARALEQISKVDTIVFDIACFQLDGGQRATILPEAKRIINSLRQLGLDMVIISGDHEPATRALAEELGIKQYFAQSLGPTHTWREHKADYIEKLQEKGKFVCFVGDGINDAIAVKQAQVSISLRGASTIATDTAQIILMDQTLNQLEELFAISQQFERNMNLNLAATVLPGIIIIGGAFTGLVGFGSAIAVSFTGLGAGVANAIWPLFQVSAKREAE